MKHRFKQVLSLALVLCMVFSLMCINIYATDDGTETADANDEIATIDDEEDGESEELSVTVYTNATTTVSWNNGTTQLIAGTDYTASGSIYATDDDTKAIATYAVTETTNVSYTYSLTDGTTAVSSVSDGDYVVIGTSGSYLTVDSDGNLSTSSEVNAYSVWKVSTNNSTYTLYNEATGYYLVLGQSSSSYGPSSYSLSTSSSGTAFSYSSSNGFYISATGGPDNKTTIYYINGTGSSTNSGSSVYAVTATAGDTTTYTYTVTITGVVVGTGTLALNDSISIDVTVTVSKYTESGLNISYGWHVANIETFTSNSNTYVAAVAASTQAMAGITSNSNITAGYITAQYNSASQDQTANYVTLGTVSGYDADVYYSGSTDGVYSLNDLNVKVYGSDETGTGTSGTALTMAQSTGNETTKTSTTTNGDGDTVTIEFTISDYSSATIYDYNYITIVPENGYYVSNIVIGCAGSLKAAAGSPYAETSENIAFTNENGNDDLFGAYGVGCTSMSKGSLDTASYDPTTGTVVELNMSDWIESHADDKGVEDPYFILIEIEKIPTPLYVEYDAGDGDGYISTNYIVDSTDSYATATNNSVAFAFDTEELKAIDYLYTVLDPTVTSYTNNGETYYFTGWAVTYYTTASTDETNTYIDSDGYILDNDGGTASYPYLSGTVALASDSISYGSGTTLYLFTHVKLVAQWTTVEPESVDYVVDFGLPVNLTLIDDISAQSSDDSSTSDSNALEDAYDWSVVAVSTQPTYGSAVVNDAANGVVYTLTDVMDGTDTLSVWLAGSQNDSVVSYKVAYVTIYPATTVYYEEGFATYGTTWSVTEGGSWTTGSTGSGTQETHVANVEGNDYNNYGYDGAYASTSAASNGTQASTSTAKDSLQFTFTGTGVDIYANCTSSTGVVLISIENSDGEEEKLLTVDTADVGSYASDEVDEIATSYNTPIASVTGLTYGEHTVTIYVSASGTTTDEDGNTTSRIGFSFDGFRVYDTISQTDDIQDNVYAADLEDNPVYTEIRDVVLTALTGSAGEDATVTEDYVDAVTSGDTQVYTSTTGGIAVYYSYSETGSTYENWNDLVNLTDDGAKNELYLPAGVTLVLKLDTSALDTDEDESTSPRTIQIGVKSTSGTGSVKLSTEEGASSVTVSSVDMFYKASVDTKTVTDDNGNTSTIYIVTITNTGSTTISLTKLKASDDVTISSEAITEEEITALLSSTEETGAEEETAVFEPESFTVSTSVKTSGKSATVTVTAKTSTDVESVTVNGVEVTSYKTVTERTGQGRNAATTTYRQFTYTETVTASGNYTYEVCAADANGTASAAATATAAVSIRSTQTGQANQIDQNKR